MIVHKERMEKIVQESAFIRALLTPFLEEVRINNELEEEGRGREIVRRQYLLAPRIMYARSK